MRTVRYDSQERVDLPDMTQMSALVLGEFRRTVRGLLLGPFPTPAPEYPSFIVRGFAVEAQAVPDGTVRVRLDPGGTSPLGFAIGGENLGSRIDFGQLIGGDGMDGSLEGNASYTLDFSAEPVGTYTVQMRFTYVDGANDNRAFWDQGVNTEFIAATDTRTIPAIELRLSGAPSDEWIDLASVVWGGATIVTGNITDLREFALEGTTPFRQATQIGTGGIADFSRSTDRGLNGFNEVYPVLRALARQVQDIKGQDDSGFFNWWNRVFTSADPADGLGIQTKTMRTLDHVMYTVSDNSTDYGDYSDLTALFTMIDAQKASLPRHITIVLKNRSTATPTFTLSSTHALDDKRIKIVGGYGGGSGVLGRTKINCTTAATGTVFTFTANGGFELENLSFTTPTNEVTMFSIGVANGQFVARNCAFFNVSSRTQVYADLPSDGLHIEGSTLGSFAGGGAGVWRIANSSLLTARLEPGRVVGSSFGIGQLLLYRGASAAALTGRVTGLRFEDCSITGMLAPLAGSAGAIQAAGALGVVFDNCDFTYLADEDCIRFASAITGGAVEYETAECAVRNCRFSAFAGTHALDLGTGVAAGTGWGVNVVGTSTKPVRDVDIDHCSFTGTAGIDGGFVRSYRSRAISVSAPHVHDVTIAATGRFTCFYAEAGTGTPLHAGFHVEDALCESFTATGTDIRGFDFVSCIDATVVRSVLRGRTPAAAAITIGAGGFVGRLTDCASCVIGDNRFEQWEDGTNDRGVLLVSSTEACVFRHNHFKDVGGRNIYLSSGGDGHTHDLFDGNLFDDDGTNLVCGIDFTGATLANDGNTYVNNRLPSGTAKDIIRLGDDRKFVCTGNSAIAGNIKHTTPGGAPFATALGYNEGFKTNVATYT